MEIRECTLEYWDAFVEASPQGTVFNKSFFLNSYNFPVDFLICWKGEEAVAGLGVVRHDHGMETIPYCVYNGIILKDFSGLSPYRVNETVFEALETFALYLFERYAVVDFTNHWEIVDMRPFDWINYNDRAKGHYQIVQRYTSLLDINCPDNTEGYARKRIRELVKGVDEGHKFLTREVDDIALLVRLHGMNFIRQGIGRSPQEDAILVRICENLMAAKAGKLLATYVNDVPVVASFFVYDKRRAYHLFVGTDLEFRDWGVGTKNFYDSCIFLNNRLGYKELDLVGVNSPQRGSYKLSYGGRLVPYYRVKKILP